MTGLEDIIGQRETGRMLKQEVATGRMAHALLLTGPRGAGKLPLALALGRRLCCTHPTDDGEACGRCTACLGWEKLAHADAHFVFPIAGVKNTCDDYLPRWREMVLENPYTDLSRWNERMGGGNAQPMIYATEADRTLRKLSLRSATGGWRVVVVWLPERMNEACANKMLKLLEEPPSKTAFLMVSEEPERLLATIVSRTQRIYVPRITEADLAEALQTRYGHSADEAAALAHRADGSLLKALELAGQSGEQALCFELFTRLMRLAWKRDIRGMKAWSEEVATLGRERQKTFLEYAQRMVRENFIANFHRPEMNYMGTDEQQFAVRFAPFIHERNIMGITDLLARAQEHVAQNVNPRMVFFDVILNMTVLIKMKNG